MKILVSGVGGFVGRHLSRSLKHAGYEVIACVREGYSPPEGMNYRIFRRGSESGELLDGVEAVVHAAGVAHQPGKNTDELKVLFQEGNYKLTVALADAVRDSPAAGMIHISSIAAAGYTSFSQGGGLSEELAIEPTGDYGISKLSCEPAVESLSEVGKLGVNLRPPLIYGSGAKGNWPKLVKLSRSRIALPFARVNNRRSFLGIDNLGHLVTAILEKVREPGLSGTYHVADSDLVSLREVVGALRTAECREERMFGFPSRILEHGLKSIGKKTMSDGLFADFILDTSKVRNAFEWEPPFGTLEGMKASLEDDTQQ